MKYLVPTLAVLVCDTAIAEDSRELDAHEHGVGELNIAVDGTTVLMELHAPGADIVGFEYKATSAEDRAAIDAAVAMLAQPLDLFVLPAAAECGVTQSVAGLENDDEHDDHDGHDDHAEHENDDEHGDHDEHAEAEDHDNHERSDEEANHTEFHAEYVLTCDNPSELSGITFAYFETFQNARELEVQIVTTTGAQAFEVERDEPTLDLRGMF